MLFALALFSQVDSLYARAESLLNARDLDGARTVAERLVAGHPDDACAHQLLGRVWYAWPVTGRYAALGEFRQAARFAPLDPEPLYWQVRVGQYLGADDGEAIAREAMLRIFALTPDYADCWSLFERIYHNADIWRRAGRVLARHPESLVALERRARIALALEEPGGADSLTDAILKRRHPYVPAYLLHAEASFSAGRDASTPHPPEGYASSSRGSGASGIRTS